MLIGHQLGPFKIDRELGSGAMGTVYRGVYVKTGQKVAIKVMLPGTASNEQAAARFEHEMEILKRLNHPNIVRIFGSGKYQGLRYYAMEFIEGDTLDKVLGRRERLPWEEVVRLGRQLCAALQHAHENGVIHRDLKPSNLMVLSDGTLKLTDFGIAKDPNLTQLTEANCTVGTASYMSPEQCKGDRNLTSKSDLYSLGIVFYELLTGRKPFEAENVMDMFMAHVKGRFERPSARVFDIPRPLDTLICQMMEKKPDQRPRDAATISGALAEVVDKVEAMHSAGVDAVTRRPGQRVSADPAPDQADREAADALLHPGKKKRKKKVEKVPLSQKAWPKAVGLVLALGGILLLAWLLLKPPGADDAYKQIEMLVAANDFQAKKRAVEEDGVIAEYLRRFGDRDDEMTKKVRVWKTDIGVAKADEELADLKVKTKKIDIEKMDALSPQAKLAFPAAKDEDEGNLTKAAAVWKDVIEKFPASDYAELGRRRLKVQYPAVQTLADQLKRHYTPIMDRAIDPLDEKNKGTPGIWIEKEEERRAFHALRAQDFGDPFEAYRLWSELKADLELKPEHRTWYLLAAREAGGLEGRVAKVQDKLAPRLENLTKRMEEAEGFAKTGPYSRALRLFLDIIVLYANSNEKEFKPFVETARKRFEEVAKLRTGQ